MRYFLMFCVLFFNSAKGYSGKKCAACVGKTEDAILFSLVRMLMCSLIGIVLIFFESSQASLQINIKMLLICVAAAVTNISFLLGWLFAIERNAMVTVDVTLTLGSIIPAVLCLILFNEPIIPRKLVGFAFIVIAALLLAGYNTGKKKNGGLGILFLMMAVLGDGLSGFIQKLYVRFCSQYPKSIFHFYMYVFSALLLLICILLFIAQNEKKDFTLGIINKPLPHIFVMAAFLFISNYLQTVLIDEYKISSQILFPFIKGGSLVVGMFVAMLFFKERPTKRSICGTIIALFGIIVLNI